VPSCFELKQLDGAAESVERAVRLGLQGAQSEREVNEVSEVCRERAFALIHEPEYDAVRRAGVEDV
jgi:hypothetical protein